MLRPGFSLTCTSWSRVAILTDPGGPVLLATTTDAYTGQWLRSSPTLEGRCCGGCVDVGEHQGCGYEEEACCDPHRPWRAGAAARRYADETVGRSQLRSSPTLEGRCCMGWKTSAVKRLPRLRSSPTLEGRCCSVVAKFTRYQQELRSSPTLEGRCCWQPRRTPTRDNGCDPHRPWRAGAAAAASMWVNTKRSSPTLEGRCCAGQLQQVTGREGEVAILTDPGGPVLHASPDAMKDPLANALRSSPTLEGRCCPPV